MTPPKTPQEIWPRILTLLGTNGGFINHTQIETIIGIGFSKAKKETDPPSVGADYLYSTKEEFPGLGLVDMGLFEDSKFVKMFLSWGHERAELPGCLQLSDTTRDLEALGWQFVGRDHMQSGSSRALFYWRTAWEAAQRENRQWGIGVRGASYLDLSLPTVSTQCVNGIVFKIWRP